MNSQAQNKWVFAFLLFPVASAILALNHFGFVFKSGPAALGILILLWMYAGQLTRWKDVLAVFAAFVFSIAGDWFLSNRHGETSRFIMGIAMFFLAHTGYLSFGLLNGRLHKVGTILILSGYLIFYFSMLAPGIDDKMLKLATLFYLLISCFSLGAALGISSGHAVFKWLYVFGITMVLFSDTIIAFREFVKFKELDFLILPTYYLAQISVTASLLSRKLIKYKINQ